MNTIIDTNKKIIFFGKLLASSTIILLSGRAGVGKSESARILKRIIEGKKITDSIMICSFADRVKFVAKCMGWDGIKNDKGRKLLQTVGNDGRDYGKDMWVKSLIEYVEKDIFVPDVTIVDDWRFPNEYEYIANLGYYNLVTIKIIAPEREILIDKDCYNDISEISLNNFNKFDYIIDNSESLNVLEINLTVIVDDLFRKEN